METETLYLANFTILKRPDLPGIDDPEIVERCMVGRTEAPVLSRQYILGFDRLMKDLDLNRYLLKTQLKGGL